MKTPEEVEEMERTDISRHSSLEERLDKTDIEIVERVIEMSTIRALEEGKLNSVQGGVILLGNYISLKSSFPKNQEPKLRELFPNRYPDQFSEQSMIHVTVYCARYGWRAQYRDDILHYTQEDWKKLGISKEELKRIETYEDMREGKLTLFHRHKIKLTPITLHGRW